MAEAFHVTVPLQDGSNTIEFSAADRAGNVATIPLQITRYSVPAVAITSPDDLAILRTATVTIWVPDAACARAMTACDGYLPLPTISRDENVRPAMVNG